MKKNAGMVEPDLDPMTRLVRIGGDEVLDRGDIEVLETPDGYRLRTGVFLPRRKAIGTFLLLHGYTEFIEKYAEVIDELLKRKYAVVTFDWRGQGLSDRTLDPASDRHQRGFVEDFSHYADDADLVYHVRMKDLPQPHYILGHSMGGHMALRILEERPYRFEKAVLSAPMVGFVVNIPLPGVVRMAHAMVLVGRGDEYAPHSTDFDPDNPINMVTSDEERWQRSLAYWIAEPRLVTHGVTWRWLYEAGRSMRRIARRDRLARLITPTLLASAGVDLIVSSEAQVELANRSYPITLSRFPTAMHEILMETDEILFDFWQRFDGFLAKPV
ncbi:MAG: alpha/beta hydrolase [Acidimicrobiia bacterium]|nr:alpha/beta hydrolase [Acidimicrobiia bacterium]